MKTKVLNKDIENYIISDVQLSIQRLGINAQLSIVELEDYQHENDENDENIVSTSFQTIPMLFKEIHIEGEVCVINHKTIGYSEVVIRLGVKYTHFNGDTNEHELGKITYLVDNSYKSEHIQDIDIYIDKVRPLVI